MVLLLTTMRVLHPQPLLRWFGTYWPALIILWGVIKLVEYQQAKREGTRPAGIGAGGVLLLVFLIVFGMSATQASRLNLGCDTQPHPDGRRRFHPVRPQLHL